MRVLIRPTLEENKLGVGGITTVLEKWNKHLPLLGVMPVKYGQEYDVELVHAGAFPFRSSRGANVAVLHGLYWTAEYRNAGLDYNKVNKRIIQSILDARAVTVPSEWVAETIRRDFRIEPYIVPHAVDIDEWEGGRNGGYIFWGKNTDQHICDPTPVYEVARRLPQFKFFATFGKPLPNLQINNGALSPENMREAMLNCSIWLHTVPETWGIASLEALAAGKPVVAFDAGYTDYIVHGINGYLAKFGDYDDLARGVQWAMENYSVLSTNARIVAGRYTWQAALEPLIEAMVQASYQRKDGVSFVITAHNKAKTLGQSIKSALGQTTAIPVQVVVVNDQSTDEIDSVMEDFCGLQNVRYITNEQKVGVAQSRNIGIAAANYDTIVTLDGDDMVSPKYVDTCYKSLRHTNRTGVVYTGLGMYYDENNIVPSDWPVDFNWQKQREGKNQVPSCSMFRREVWRRCGGYRSRYNRYHLLGYGTEDAAFWTTAALNGFDIKQVTNEALFLYRPGGGTSTNYTEIPWDNVLNHREYLPASAPRDKDEYPSIRIYYPPRVSIIIPVGEGHEILVQDAIDSAVAQSYYRNEIIVVWDSPTTIPQWYLGGYPFVKWIRRRRQTERLGAGAARNMGAKAMHPKSRHLVFLDADDMLHRDYLRLAVSALNANKAIVYTDYIGEQLLPDGAKPDAVVGLIDYDPIIKMCYTRAHLKDFDMELAVQQPQDPPYVWCPVTALIPRAWFDKVGGFNESLETWEDWDLHIRMARAGYSFYRLQQPLLRYRLWAGKRREYGRSNFKELDLFSRIGKGD